MQGQVYDLITRYIPGPYRNSGGPNLAARCPFHKGGNEHSPSFAVNIETGAWQCFTCHEAGFLPKLLRMLGVGGERADVELDLVRPVLTKAKEQRQFKNDTRFNSKDPYEAKFILKESLLGVYDWVPNRLVEYDQFDIKLLQSKQIGFDRKLERITYPIRDMYGNLAGISGGATRPEQKPKYLVYQGGSKKFEVWQDGNFGKRFDEQYPGYHCENKGFIWNFDTVWPRIWESPTSSSEAVYVVEGYKACLWMLQCGFLNTVALMGSSLSPMQQSALERLQTNIVLFLDNDEAGERGTWHVGRRLLAPMHHRVWVMSYPAGEWLSQPDDYVDSVLHTQASRLIPWSEFNRVHPQYEQQHNQWREQ